MSMIDIKENIPIAPYTIYKIGGNARFFVEVSDNEGLKQAAGFAAERHLSFVILGAGSNVLISDNGFNGLVIHMNGGGVSVEGDRMRVDAGVMMARAVVESGKASLTGFEWGIGVPGTIGGSIRGNAGCFGGEMKDIIESVDIFDFQTATRYTLHATRCAFDYRDSIFKKHPEWVIIFAVLKLKKGNAVMIQQEIRRISEIRVTKQDIGAKCCGCIFKNVTWPEDDDKRAKLLAQFPELMAFRDRTTIPSAFLIDGAGMKGMNAGNICISNKHANFFINIGGGTSEDVIALITLVKEKVKEKFGIELHEEICLIGF